MISSADSTPPYALDMPVSIMITDALHLSTMRSKLGVCPCTQHAIPGIPRTRTRIEVRRAHADIYCTHPNDPPCADALLQLPRPLAHNLVIPLLGEAAPPVRSARLVQLLLGARCPGRQARVRIGRVREGEGRSERAREERVAELVYPGGVWEEMRERRAERAVCERIGRGGGGRVKRDERRGAVAIQ